MQPVKCDTPTQLNGTKAADAAASSFCMYEKNAPAVVCHITSKQLNYRTYHIWHMSTQHHCALDRIRQDDESNNVCGCLSRHYWFSTRMPAQFQAVSTLLGVAVHIHSSVIHILCSTCYQLMHMPILLAHVLAVGVNMYDCDGERAEKAEKVWESIRQSAKTK